MSSRGKLRPSSCPPPSAPGSVSSSAGANRATVTWSAASGNGNTISAYVVREVTGPDPGASIATDGSTTTATLTGLAGGAAATFSVVAESSCGSGPPGTSAAVTPTGSASTYLGSLLAGTPSALYRLAEPSGTVMADSSGHGSDGSYSGQETLGGGPALASDPAPSAGYATCCNGIGTGNAALPLYNDARTVEAWINTASTAANQAVAGYGQTSTDDAFIVSVSPWAIAVDGYNDYLQFPVLRPLDDGHWHLITVTYDGTTVQAYLDGQPVGNGPFSGTVNTLNPSGLALAGFAGYNAFAGHLADVAVYPSALTPATVAAHFTASGYSRPTAAKSVNASYGGPNAADVTWGYATAAGGPVTGYLVSALGGAQGASSVAVPGDATAARLTGLAAGTYTFQVVALDPFGSGPAVTTKAFTVTGPASTYASTVLTAGPSVFYRLADFRGGAMADSSGQAGTGAYNTANATLGLPGPLAADPGTAIANSGNGPAASAAPSLPLYAQPRTVEGWVSTTRAGWLASYGITGTGGGFGVAVQAGAVIVSGANDDLTFSTTTPITDGNWHFIAVTTDGASATVYLDGASLGTRTFPSTLNTVPGPLGFLVGGGIANCCGGFSGGLADVAVFPSALTAAQVAAQFAAAGLTPPAPTAPAATAGTNQATVTWQPPSGSQAPVTGYLVTAVTGGATANAVAVPASATTATVTGLAGGTSYTFDIQALNEYGAGPAATTAAVIPAGAAATYASTVLSLGPSVFYRLADSGAMADSSGHAATGRYNASVTTPGQPGPLANDPAAAIVSTGNGPAAQGAPQLPLYAQPRTLEGWVNTTSAGANWLAGYGVGNTGQGFAVYIQPDAVTVSGSGDDLTFATPGAVDDGHWHFIAVTTNGTSATMYLDGTSLGTRRFPHVLDTLPTYQGFYVGASEQDCCGSFNGGLANVAVFPSALTAAQVAAQFAASGLGLPGAPTVPAATPGANQATVTWHAPLASTPPVTGYLVTAVTGGATVNAVAVPASATTATVTGLAGGTSYTFDIQALNEYGAGPAATTAAVIPAGAAATYASTVLSLGPSVFYRLADSGGVMADSSGHHVAGAYSATVATLGLPGPLTGDPATAIGDNDSGPAARAAAALPLYAQPRTLEGWVKTPSGGWMAGYGTGAQNQGFGVDIQPNGVLVSGSSDDLTFTSTSTITDGNWHFIAVTSDGTSATVYLDGTSLGTKTFPVALDTVPAPEGFLIGACYRNFCGGLSGDLADVAVFPSALTAAQVAAQFTASGNSLGRPTHSLRSRQLSSRVNGDHLWHSTR